MSESDWEFYSRMREENEASKRDMAERQKKYAQSKEESLKRRFGPLLDDLRRSKAVALATLSSKIPNEVCAAILTLDEHWNAAREIETELMEILSTSQSELIQSGAICCIRRAVTEKNVSVVFTSLARIVLDESKSLGLRVNAYRKILVFRGIPYDVDEFVDLQTKKVKFPPVVDWHLLNELISIERTESP